MSNQFSLDKYYTRGIECNLSLKGSSFWFEVVTNVLDPTHSIGVNDFLVITSFYIQIIIYLRLIFSL